MSSFKKWALERQDGVASEYTSGLAWLVGVLIILVACAGAGLLFWGANGDHRHVTLGLLIIVFIGIFALLVHLDERGMFPRVVYVALGTLTVIGFVVVVAAYFLTAFSQP